MALDHAPDGSEDPREWVSASTPTCGCRKPHPRRLTSGLLAGGAASNPSVLGRCSRALAHKDSTDCRRRAVRGQHGVWRQRGLRSGV